MCKAIDGMKICSKCRDKKLIAEFSLDCGKGDGLQYECKQCQGERSKEYSAKSKIIVHRKNYKKIWGTTPRGKNIIRKHNLKEFGITPEQYDLMFKDQAGMCAICGKTEMTKDHRTGRVRNLAVDHDHNTGKIRSLLCSVCNTHLGIYEKHCDVLAAYLKKYFKQ